MLHINNACIAFGTEVLFSGFSMKLERGETACIVGQSGCGKTSLLNAVMGFVPLKEGSIQVGETLLDISTIDSVRRQIAWIPQELGHGLNYWPCFDFYDVCSYCYFKQKGGQRWKIKKIKLEICIYFLYL